MYKALKKMKEDNKEGVFLFPSLPDKVIDKIAAISEDMAVVESKVDGKVRQLVTHPNNICVVHKKG